MFNNYYQSAFVEIGRYFINKLMDKEIDITNWITDGQDLLGFKLEGKTNTVKLQECQFIGRDDIYGYYYSKEGWRIGVNDGIIDEISIPFPPKEENISISLLLNGKAKNIRYYKIHELLNLFNELNLEWQPVNNKDTSRLVILLKASSIYVTFDIYEGTVELLS